VSNLSSVRFKEQLAAMTADIAGRPLDAALDDWLNWGNRVKTRATFQGGWTMSGDKYIRNAAGSYTDLPKTATGKRQRFKLREQVTCPK
jgi:hypothetical protein